MDESIRIKPPTDFAHVAACFAEVRGKNYYSPRFYDTAYLASGQHEILAAYDRHGEIAGVTGISNGFFGDEKSLLTLLNIRHKYEGMGIGKELLAQSVHMLEKRGVRAIKGHNVTAHIATQVILGNLGLMPTGMLYGIRDGKNTAPPLVGKSPLAIYVHNVSVKDVGVLYVHDSIAAFARHVYDNLGVSAAFENSSRWAKKTIINHYYDSHDSVLVIQVLQAAQDIADCLAALRASYSGAPTFTLTVLLNLADASAIPAFNCLHAAGYTFSGFDPLGQHEHAVFFAGYGTMTEMKTTPMLEEFLQKSNRGWQ